MAGRLERRGPGPLQNVIPGKTGTARGVAAMMWRSRIEWVRKAREFAVAVKALASTSHPIAAHVIPIRRCNLACKYCNEFDDFSPPVPSAEMLRRIDQLAALGLGVLTFSGGEPLLHPDLDLLIRRVRRRGLM